MYIISACLLGENCKYSGGNNACQWVIEFAKTHSHIIVCPETEGGLTAPRPPAEIIGDKIIDSEGKDVTEAFLTGAKLSYERAQSEASRKGEQIEGAILKAKSPSCGRDKIYDGTFSGTLIDGDGCLVRLLKQDDINVITEKEKIDND